MRVLKVKCPSKLLIVSLSTETLILELNIFQKVLNFDFLNRDNKSFIRLKATHVHEWLSSKFSVLEWLGRKFNGSSYTPTEVFMKPNHECAWHGFLWQLVF